MLSSRRHREGGGEGGEGSWQEGGDFSRVVVKRGRPLQMSRLAELGVAPSSSGAFANEGLSHSHRPRVR